MSKKDSPTIRHPKAFAMVISLAIVAFVVAVVVSIAGSYFFTTRAVYNSRQAVNASRNDAALAASIASCNSLRDLTGALDQTNLGASPVAKNISDAVTHLYVTQKASVGAKVYTCIQLTGPPKS